MRYKLDEVETDVVWHIYGESDSEPTATLRGGMARAIARTWKTLARHNQERASDFLTGVLAGLQHTQSTRLPGQKVWLLGGVADVYASMEGVWEKVAKTVRDETAYKLQNQHVDKEIVYHLLDTGKIELALHHFNHCVENRLYVGEVEIQ